MEGGHKQVEGTKIVRITFTFGIGSTRQMYDKLQNAGVKLVQAKPMKIQFEPKTLYWFQCYEPSGNIVEFLGGE